MHRKWFIAKLQEHGFVPSLGLLQVQSGNRYEVYRQPGTRHMVFIRADLETLDPKWVRKPLSQKTNLTEEEITQFLTFH